jgi:hypothetical protein
MAATILFASGPAMAAGATFTVSVTVPAACFVQVPSDLSISDGGSTSGTVVEACNSGGYTVTANYRALAADEGAVLQYNGQTINLPADGEVVVRVSTMATIKQVAYALQSTHLDAPLALSLNIEPS